MQTIYKMIAVKNPPSPAIESLLTDYSAVMRIKNNMELAGWDVVVQWVNADWKVME